MSDEHAGPEVAGGPALGDEPSEEELRAYLGQLRAAPAEQVLAEILSGLLNAVQVKIGRRDARVLLDGAAALIGEVRPVLDEALLSQLDELVTQLRLAQVRAEAEVAAAARQGEVEPNDIPATAEGAPTDEGESPSAPPTSSGPDATSRLWVPGR